MAFTVRDQRLITLFPMFKEKDSFVLFPWCPSHCFGHLCLLSWPWCVHLHTPYACYFLAGKTTKLQSWPLLGAVSMQPHLIFTTVLLERYDFADNKLRPRGAAKLGHKTSKGQLGFTLGLCDWEHRPFHLGDLGLRHGGEGRRSAQCG